MLEILVKIFYVILAGIPLIGACFFKLEPDEKWWHRGIVYLVLIFLIITFHMLTSTH
jgi:hypothetical protein